MARNIKRLMCGGNPRRVNIHNETAMFLVEEPCRHFAAGSVRNRLDRYFTVRPGFGAGSRSIPQANYFGQEDLGSKSESGTRRSTPAKGNRFALKMARVGSAGGRRSLTRDERQAQQSVGVAKPARLLGRFPHAPIVGGNVRAVPQSQVTAAPPTTGALRFNSPADPQKVAVP
jgi:hypothetical protein